MEDLVLYLCSALTNAGLELTPDEVEVGCTIIATAVPLMLFAAVLGVLLLAIASTFNFLRGRKRDI